MPQPPEVKVFRLAESVVDPLPQPKNDAALNPPIFSNQQLLEKNINEALKASDVVYEQAQGENFLGC